MFTHSNSCMNVHEIDFGTRINQLQFGIYRHLYSS